MNILQVIAKNGTRAPQTLRFPDRPVPGAGFRGGVTHDPDGCIACGICAQVCVSAAIEVDPGSDRFTWSYNPSCCTFCGLCVARCPVDALSQAADRAGWYTRPGDQAATSTVVYPTCPDCDVPTLPFGEALLRRAYGDVSDEVRRRAQLCPACRRQDAARRPVTVHAALRGAERTQP